MNLPKHLNIIIEGNTVFIDTGSKDNEEDFFFSFTPADAVVKSEAKGKYRNFGGLQSNLEHCGSKENALYDTLCSLAETILIELDRMPK